MNLIDTKKEQERARLHSAIWKAATDLVHGGGVTPVEFKSYVIGFLFYRFISENLTNYINRAIVEITHFKLAYCIE